MNTAAFSYIPQRPPFVMIGELISVDERQTITNFTIREDNIFVNNGIFSESGMIENMAQTAGAGVGYRIQMEGKPLQIGYIAALKNIQIHALPKVNDTITTEITMQQKVLSFHLVNGKVMCGDKEMATCEFKIFVNSTQPTP